MKKAYYEGETDLYLTNLGKYDVESISGETVYLKVSPNAVVAVHRNRCTIFEESEIKATPLKVSMENMPKMTHEEAVEIVQSTPLATMGVSPEEPARISLGKDGWKFDGKSINMNNTDIVGYSPFCEPDEKVGINYYPGEKDTEEDLINEPNHYHKGGIDIYGIMGAKFNNEKEKGFCIGNVLKYVIRHEMKGGIEDLKKARFNLDRLIELTEKE